MEGNASRTCRKVTEWATVNLDCWKDVPKKITEIPLGYGRILTAQLSKKPTWIPFCAEPFLPKCPADEGARHSVTVKKHTQTCNEFVHKVNFALFNLASLYRSRPTATAVSDC